MFLMPGLELKAHSDQQSPGIREGDGKKKSEVCWSEAEGESGSNQHICMIVLTPGQNSH